MATDYEDLVVSDDATAAWKFNITWNDTTIETASEFINGGADLDESAVAGLTGAVSIVPNNVTLTEAIDFNYSAGATLSKIMTSVNLTNLGGADLALEVLLKFEGAPSADAVFFDAAFQSGVEGAKLWYDHTAGKFKFTFVDDTLVDREVSSTTTPAADTFYHLAGFSGSVDRYIYLTVNGIEEGKVNVGTGISVQSPSSSTVFTVGPFTGKIQMPAMYYFSATVYNTALALTHYNLLAAVSPDATLVESLLFNSTLAGNGVLSLGIIESLLLESASPITTRTHIGAIADALILVSSDDYSLGNLLQDSFLFTEAQKIDLEQFIQFVDSLALGDAALLIRSFAFSDNFVIGDTLADLRGWYEKLLDKVKFADSLVTQQQVNQTLALIWALGDVIEIAHSRTLSDSFELLDLVSYLMEANMVCVDSLAASDSIAGSMLVAPLVTDSLVLTDVTTPAQVLSRLLADNLEFILYFDNNLAEYSGWVLNTKNAGTTQYSGYNFNSVAKIGKEYWGAGPTGLYKLTNTDNNDVVPWKLTTGAMALGGLYKTRVPEAYLGIQHDGRVLLKTITGDQKERWYEVNSPLSGIDMRRVKLAKGVESSFWQFTLENVDGTDVDIHSLNFVPVILKRRV